MLQIFKKFGKKYESSGHAEDIIPPRKAQKQRIDHLFQTIQNPSIHKDASLQRINLTQKLDNTVDFLHSFIDNMIKNYEYETISLFLRNINVAFYEKHILIRILELTFRARRFIPYHRQYWKKVCSILEQREEYDYRQMEGLK